MISAFGNILFRMLKNFYHVAADIAVVIFKVNAFGNA
jgi:hypothetical protein